MPWRSWVSNQHSCISTPFYHQAVMDPNWNSRVAFSITRCYEGTTKRDDSITLIGRRLDSCESHSNCLLWSLEYLKTGIICITSKTHHKSYNQHEICLEELVAKTKVLSHFQKCQSTENRSSQSSQHQQQRSSQCTPSTLKLSSSKFHPESSNRSSIDLYERGDDTRIKL